jgi:hypothetical protein
MEERRPLDRPRGWQRLSRGLVAYGIIGLVVASIGLGSTLWVNGRISHLRADAEATVARLATTMQLAAIVLSGASTTAGGFSGTVDQTAEAVAAAAATMTETRSDLLAVEAQLRSVNILGATPLSSPADSVGRIAASINGLDAQLSLISGDLKGNGAALARNAAAISALGNSTAALAKQLGANPGQDSFGDVQQVIAITLLMFATWSFVPAAGALALGLWLWRRSGPSTSP